MQGRPPKRLTPEQQQAADTFIDAAEPDRTGKASPSSSSAPSSSSPPESTSRPPRYPWEEPHVRDDVTKGYPLRLPEKLYLKLKFVSEETGQSMNQLCNDAVASVVEERLATLVER